MSNVTVYHGSTQHDDADSAHCVECAEVAAFGEWARNGYSFNGPQVDRYIDGLAASYTCSAQRGIGVKSFACFGRMCAAFDVATREPVLQCDRCGRVAAAEPAKK